MQWNRAARNAAGDAITPLQRSRAESTRLASRPIERLPHSRRRAWRDHAIERESRCVWCSCRAINSGERMDV